jgi:hypothetical protein
LARSSSAALYAASRFFIAANRSVSPLSAPGRPCRTASTCQNLNSSGTVPPSPPATFRATASLICFSSAAILSFALASVLMTFTSSSGAPRGTPM